MSETGVSIQDLTVVHDGRVALEAVTTEIDPASSVAVIGSNGSGKSTLLRCLAGLQTPTSGSIDLHRASVALVPQHVQVDRTLQITVAETVRMGRFPARGLFGRIGASDRAAVGAALDRLGIADLADRTLHELSGGQRQRTLVAQALAQNAGVLLLDEPMTGLDVASRAVILDVIDHHRDGGGIVFVATHELDDARRCDRVLLLATRCTADGPPETVLTADNLSDAFGGRVRSLASGELVVDDPHHQHEHR